MGDDGAMPFHSSCLPSLDNAPPVRTGGALFIVLRGPSCLFYARRRSEPATCAAAIPPLVVTL